MGFFKKIFKRRRNKKNKKHSKDEGAFLPDNVHNSHDDMIRKPSFHSKNAAAQYDAFRSPELVQSDSKSKKSKASVKESRSHDSSYGSSFDSREDSYATANRPQASQVRVPSRNPGPNTSPNSFEADFSGFGNENNANVANQMQKMVPHQRKSPQNNHALNYDELQQFEMQQRSRNDGSYQHPYNQPPPKKLQLTRLPSGQLVAVDAINNVGSPHSINSEFDLSTDAEDNEYNRIRGFDGDNFSPMLGSPSSPSLSAEEDAALSPGGLQNMISKTRSSENNQNKLFMSNSSEYESFPAVTNNRSRHYFSDSDHDLDMTPVSRDSGGMSPVSQASSNQQKPPSKFTFQGEYDGSRSMSSDNFGRQEDQEALAPKPVSPLGSPSDGPSPRTLAIQEAQKARNNFDFNQDAYTNSTDSVEDSGIGQGSTSPTKQTISPSSFQNPSEGVITNFVDFENNQFGSSSGSPDKAAKTVADPTYPVSDLLAKAKQRRNNRQGGNASVNSAPNVNVNGRRVPRPTVSATAKEKLQQRRKEKKEWLRNNGTGSDEDDGNGDNESWLYKEVSGTLGPQGIQADLESLGEKSYRSKTSVGNRSHRSRSRRPRGSDASVGSRHSRSSRASRASRASRYSIKSTKSHLSQMSVESRSVANDLIRLEMQLAMVGANKNGENELKKELESEAQKKGITGLHVVRNGSTSSVGPGGSVGARSRGSRASSRASSRPKNRAKAAVRRLKSNVKAPPGKLGIILANKNDARGTVVSGVRTTSVLADKISPGDRIIAIDGEDVSRMTVTEITAIMARKSDYERILSVLAAAK